MYILLIFIILYIYYFNIYYFNIYYLIHISIFLVDCSKISICMYFFFFVEKIIYE
jgi:hypothetical protein